GDLVLTGDVVDPMSRGEPGVGEVHRRRYDRSRVEAGQVVDRFLRSVARTEQIDRDAVAPVLGVLESRIADDLAGRLIDDGVERGRHAVDTDAVLVIAAVLGSSRLHVAAELPAVE